MTFGGIAIYAAEHVADYSAKQPEGRCDTVMTIRARDPFLLKYFECLRVLRGAGNLAAPVDEGRNGEVRIGL